MLKILFILIIGIYTLLNNVYAQGEIRFDVSPIKYVINASPGETITRTAKLSNYTGQDLFIRTGKSDFEQNGTNGTPALIRKSELVNPDQMLSERITINTDSFNIANGEVKEIMFAITVPSDGIPGGHYGAVFFKNDNSGTSSGNQVAINVDMGVLILLNVDGEINTEAEVNTPTISSNSGHYENPNKKDKCPMGDFTKSKYDGKCLDKPKEIIDSITGEENNSGTTNKGNELDENNNLNNECGIEGCESAKNDDKENDNKKFNIGFEVPIDNTGNTHVKPKGKIILVEVDENGDRKQIKNIGKEIILNDKGLEIGEKIVDYLPINDREGYILPNSKRIFKIDWEGFPYKDYDDLGNPIIKYWKPSTYYTKKNIEDAGFLMFWERVNEEIKTKKIEAIFNVSYLNEEGELEEYESAQEFDIIYKEKIVEANPYIILLIAIFGAFIFFIWLILILRKKRCIKCDRRIDRDIEICPYCKADQNKKFKFGNKKKKSKKG